MGAWTTATSCPGRPRSTCLTTRVLPNWPGAPIPRRSPRADPACLAAWAELAEQALDRGELIAGYAYARTGYHRGLDQLRRAGWKGHGPIPWEHEPNRGFLRSLHALGRAAGAIGETEEEARCQIFLADSSAAAVAALDA